MEYYSAIKRNEKLFHATRWKSLENIMPSQRSQLQKTTQSIIPFKGIGKSIKTEGRLVVA